MTRIPSRLALWLPLVVVAACSDYWGSGPDPSRAGPYLLGASGSSSAGVGNTAGAGNDCSTDPLALVLVAADANCSDVQTCAQRSCDQEIRQCLGAEYARGTITGQCTTNVKCASDCRCNDSCVQGCANPNDGCTNCVVMLENCLQSQCGAALEACPAASARPRLLAQNLNSNIDALALDDDSLYFTTNTGIAKIPKTGGAPKALGGFNNLRGLAVSGGFIYVVTDSGAVSRMKTDGTQQMPIVTSTSGGGSGPIAIDGTTLFYVVGPYVRRAPAAGGAPEQIADDVWQMGATSGQRIGLDASAVYYVGGAQNGGASTYIASVSRQAAAVGTDMLGQHPGAPLVTPNGEIRSLVSDGKLVYFANLASDGLKMTFEIQRLDPASKKTVQLASVAPMGNSTGLAALATDGTNVFFGASSGLYSVAVDGKSEAVVLDGSALPSAIVVDDTYIYWADQTNSGALKRLMKPN